MLVHSCRAVSPVACPWAAGVVPLPRRSACGASAGEVAASTPWFDEYRAEFFRMLLFNDHETFDHPLACAPRPPPLPSTLWPATALQGQPLPRTLQFF